MAVPEQVPEWQASCVVHALLSLQLVPSAAFGLLHVPVEGLQVPATWQLSCAVQVTAVPEHVPEWHASLVVHALLSLHDVPSDAFGLLHAPVDTSQVPAVWQLSCAVHVTAVPEQVPEWHASLVVHALLSLHDVPSDAFGLLQVPVDGSQVPAVWQLSCAVHVTAVPEQVPEWHASLVVHALLSLHEVPSAAFGLLHVPVVGLHVPATWQLSRAVQVTAVPKQVPD
jgi:hypothetical protein